MLSLLTDHMGQRRLAAIKIQKGVYHILDIESVPSAVNKLESYQKFRMKSCVLTVVKGERTESRLTEQSSEASA